LNLRTLAPQLRAPGLGTFLGVQKRYSTMSPALFGGNLARGRGSGEIVA
jgi:hypothetical protein